MARNDFYDRDEEARRLARLRDRENSGSGVRPQNDFGQADYSDRYGYDPDGRRGFPIARDGARSRDVHDFGQADYSNTYAYDEAERRGYRRRADGTAFDRDEDERTEPRTFAERVGGVFGGHRHEAYAPQPRRPTDRALWEAITQRLSRERHLDLRDVDVLVEDREVTLNGRVRTKADKRRIEDIADMDGVRHVQNNLRAREHDHWTFL